MWELKSLSDNQIQQCLNTVSSNTLLFIVGDAIINRKDLSIVRMADGEHILMGWCRMQKNLSEIVQPTKQLDEAWIRKFGIEGITYKELYMRLHKAANECTYFAASLSGITMSNYDCFNFSTRERYVDNFYTYGWSEEYKIGLYKAAGRILMIHHDEEKYQTLKARAKNYLGIDVHHLKMANWKDADRVIFEANEINAPLTIFSAGPAGKIIGPRIKGVTLDVGSGMDKWLLPELQALENSKKRLENLKNLCL